MNRYKIKYDTRITPDRVGAEAFTVRQTIEAYSEDKDAARDSFLSDADENMKIISIRLFNS